LVIEGPSVLQATCLRMQASKPRQFAVRFARAASGRHSGIAMIHIIARWHGLSATLLP
jgi:hypothetical protein